MKLTLAQQRALIKALSPAKKSAVKRHCIKCKQRGDGLGSILKSVGKILGPIAKEIGPTVMKELVIPFVKNKISGKGLSLAGQGCCHGKGLRLAGQGKKKRKTRKSKK